MAIGYNVWRVAGLPPVEPLAAAQRLYALVDGAQLDDFRRYFRNTRGVLDKANLAGSALSADVENAGQHVLHLEDNEALKHVVERIMRSTTSHGAMSVIVSSLELSALADALRKRLHVTLPDQFDCVNRFFDGRVTPHWLSILTPEQRELFTAFASQWWVVSHEHVWISLACTEIHPDLFDQPMGISERQQADMIDACYPYTVIDHFELTDPELLERLPPAEQYAWFERALAAARTHGIDDGPQSMLFCTLTLTRGERFYEAPAWYKGLAQVRQGQTRLRDLMKAIDD
jgi:hypothetical protein